MNRGVSRRHWLAWAGSVPAVSVAAQAGLNPSRPIVLVVPFAPGGIADLTARAVAQAMATSLGQPVVVDNRPSAGSIVASQLVAHAAPDGHTLLLMSNAHAISASLFRALPYDAARDFAPIALLARFDLGLFVAGTSPHHTLSQWLAQARARPGRMTIGTVVAGSTQHLAAELFKARAGVDAVVVPYKGTPAVLGALRAGEIDLAVEILGPWVPQVQAGAVRALAVASTERSAVLPEVPTLAQAGIERCEASSWNGLAAPAATPAAVLQRLNRAVDAALREPAVRAQLQPLGVRLVGGTPEQLQQWLQQETQRWSALVRSAKIEVQ